MKPVRIAFAGRRRIAADVLRYLSRRSTVVLAALLIPAEWDRDGLAPMAAKAELIRGTAFREPSGIEALRALNLDYIVSVHFPLLFPESVLVIPKRGVINLHPGLLPWNRGWHTPSWAILDQTPAGATLHYVNAGLDTGDIIDQHTTPILPSDTAHSLHQRITRDEYRVFRRAWPKLEQGTAGRIAQNHEAATSHARADLLDPRILRIDLDKPTTPRHLLNRLRALTTNDTQEAAYFEEGETRYRVRVEITADQLGHSSTQ